MCLSSWLCKEIFVVECEVRVKRFWSRRGKKKNRKKNRASAGSQPRQKATGGVVYRASVQSWPQPGLLFCLRLTPTLISVWLTRAAIGYERRSHTECIGWPLDRLRCMCWGFCDTAALQDQMCRNWHKYTQYRALPFARTVMGAGTRRWVLVVGRWAASPNQVGDKRSQCDNSCATRIAISPPRRGSGEKRSVCCPGRNHRYRLVHMPDQFQIGV